MTVVAASTRPLVFQRVPGRIVVASVLSLRQPPSSSPSTADHWERRHHRRASHRPRSLHRAVQSSPVAGHMRQLPLRPPPRPPLPPAAPPRAPVSAAAGRHCVLRARRSPSPPVAAFRARQPPSPAATSCQTPPPSPPVVAARERLAPAISVSTRGEAGSGRGSAESTASTPRLQPPLRAPARLPCVERRQGLASSQPAARGGRGESGGGGARFSPESPVPG